VLRAASGSHKLKPMMYEAEKSDSPKVPMKPANKAGRAAAGPVEGSGGTKRNARLQSTVRTQSRGAVSQAQSRIRRAATRNRKEKLTALHHHISVECLRWSFFKLKKDSAPGIDGITWEQYAADLERNLTDLHARVHSGAYRARPSRRVYIPKVDGRQRPLGIAAVEDKIVQMAVVAILTPIYEAEFLGFSYGFRPGRGQHDALDALCVGTERGKTGWILDADISRFFDTISHEWLVKFMEHRIGDTRILRLIQKWLKAGVMEEGLRTDTQEGTPQGAVISPLLANIYLHYVLDLWTKRWRNRVATGDMIVVRYADDVIFGFQHKREAERFLRDLKERLESFALSLNTEKTHLIEFGRFAASNRARRGEGKPETFAFLGFTHLCYRRPRDRAFSVLRQTQRKRMSAELREIKESLRRRMNDTIDSQGKWLASVLRGHYAYYAVPGNNRALSKFHYLVSRNWFRRLWRRGQRYRIRWYEMKVYLQRYLPAPRIVHPWPNARFDVKHSR